jgi:hypothetical protein
MMMVTMMLRTALPKPGGSLEIGLPEGGSDAEAQGNDGRRSEDADEQTPAPAWVESDRRQNRASLTMWNGEGDGECDCDHRKGNGDQRCDPACGSASAMASVSP